MKCLPCPCAMKTNVLWTYLKQEKKKSSLERDGEHKIPREERKLMPFKKNLWIAFLGSAAENRIPMESHWRRCGRCPHALSARDPRCTACQHIQMGWPLPQSTNRAAFALIHRAPERSKNEWKEFLHGNTESVKISKKKTTTTTTKTKQKSSEKFNFSGKATLERLPRRKFYDFQKERKNNQKKRKKVTRRQFCFGMKMQTRCVRAWSACGVN